MKHCVSESGKMRFVRKLPIRLRDCHEYTPLDSIPLGKTREKTGYFGLVVTPVVTGRVISVKSRLRCRLPGIALMSRLELTCWPSQEAWPGNRR